MTAFWVNDNVYIVVLVSFVNSSVYIALLFEKQVQMNLCIYFGFFRRSQSVASSLCIINTGVLAFVSLHKSCQ